MTGSFLRWFSNWWKGRSDQGFRKDEGVVRPEEPCASVPTDDDLDWLHPPRDVHCLQAWDEYWYKQTSNSLALGFGLFGLFCDDEELIAVMRRRGLTTILCAGNGISQEPRALAAAGFSVTALDSSAVAMEIAQSFNLEAAQLQRFFPSELCAPGGSANFVVGDLRDLSVSPGPFDVVIERRTLQLFPPNERGPALDALAQRLRPDGILISHCHNGGWRPDQPRLHPLEPLFSDKGWTIEEGYRSFQPESRVAWLILSTG